ncbi:hypothetical protein [Agromyces aerolatus]|uniref:hypothetical protein n=1 Tax=Agromyces sp. LY-1074 TaxID=3074080 RepID=UPI00285B996F|nr:MULTISPECIES: hypothetical protein [unclassified Agromyces]MDR5701460.1 hypothetical protein [Agromyces sp. LY-1074]MDR5704473.1 hypothetical protein [Agromyces sp. LY-1358]
MRSRPAARRMTLAMAVAVAVAGLAGCSSETPPWLSGATEAPATSSAPPTTTPPAPVQNDLAAGSATRTVPIGAITLTIDYWSTLTMDLWTANASKPLSFSIRGTVEPADGQKLYLSRVTAETVVRDADGEVLPGPDPIADQSTVAPGYLILDPYTYSQTFTLPALDPAAASIEVSMRYELLQQATPTSADYAKQTAVDTLTIAIAPQPTDAEPADED